MPGPQHGRSISGWSVDPGLGKCPQRRFVSLTSEETREGTPVLAVRDVAQKNKTEGLQDL